MIFRTLYNYGVVFLLKFHNGIFWKNWVKISPRFGILHNSRQRALYTGSWRGFGTFPKVSAREISTSPRITHHGPKFWLHMPSRAGEWNRTCSWVKIFLNTAKIDFYAFLSKFFSPAITRDHAPVRGGRWSAWFHVPARHSEVQIFL